MPTRLVQMEMVPGNWFWRDGEVDGGPSIVFDMDGVLSDAAGRQHYLDSVFPDWEGFFQACGDDALIEEVVTLLTSLDKDLKVVLLTARPMRVQPQTLAWLERYGLRWDLLIMRDFGDYMASRIFKERSVNELRAFGFELILGFEDDQRNVEMFRSKGVPCVYIHSGYYD